jgi:hypothetical protein
MSSSVRLLYQVCQPLVWSAGGRDARRLLRSGERLAPLAWRRLKRTLKIPERKPKGTETGAAKQDGDDNGATIEKTCPGHRVFSERAYQEHHVTTPETNEGEQAEPDPDVEMRSSAHGARGLTMRVRGGGARASNMEQKWNPAILCTRLVCA